MVVVFPGFFRFFFFCFFFFFFFFYFFFSSSVYQNSVIRPGFHEESCKLQVTDLRQLELSLYIYIYPVKTARQRLSLIHI